MFEGIRPGSEVRMPPKGEPLGAREIAQTREWSEGLPAGGLVAAVNRMGEVRVWETGSGREVARRTTGALTRFGIIKGHCYTGRIFALCFGPGDGMDGGKGGVSAGTAG